jgi:phosphoglycolate phosphatase-like HAD superfamily hydrolase
MDRPPYDLILFDLDGTIVDSLGTKVQTAGLLWKDVFGVSAEEVEAAYLRYSGIPRRELFDKIAETVLICPLPDEVFGYLSEEFTRRNIAALRECPLVAGAEELLLDLAGAGVYLAVSSSAEPTEVNARLKGMHDHLFKAVLGSLGSFSKGRPHVRYLAGAAQCPREKILMVGDEPPDLHLAREAGVKVALVAQTRPFEELGLLFPEILVRTLADLRPYVLPGP